MNINLIEGKVVAPAGMKVGIVASRFNSFIVEKLLDGAGSPASTAARILTLHPRRKSFRPFAPATRKAMLSSVTGKAI